MFLLLLLTTATVQRKTNVAGGQQNSMTVKDKRSTKQHNFSSILEAVCHYVMLIYYQFIQW